MSDDATPTDFNFPGTPYDVQQQLMTAMYETMTNGRIGLFESPTGTGKTLSIICSTLTWLKNNRAPPSTNPNSKSPEPEDPDEPSWVVDQTAHRHATSAADYLRQRARAYRSLVKNTTLFASPYVSSRLAAQPGGKRPRGRRLNQPNADRDLDDLFADLDGPDTTNVPARPTAISAWSRTNEDKPRTVRIIFATRTHSQLAQFVQELQKTSFNPPSLAEANAQLKAQSFASDGEPEETALQNTPFSVVLFGSRKQTCVNDEVRNLGTASAISERCHELTERTETGGGKRKRNHAGCVYHDAETERVLSDRLLIGAHEIEDVSRMGKELGACPYFAMRSVMADGQVEVIGAPYSAVLHKGTRESVGITVDEDTIVVFDEGHNVTAAVRELHSCVISGHGLRATIDALKGYMNRYEGRFTTSNLFKLRQVVTVAEGFADILSKGKVERVLCGADLVFEAGVDNVNLFDLVAYMKEARLSKKLRGFIVEDVRDNKLSPEVKLNQERKAKQSIASFERLIECVCECGNFGRVAIYPAAAGGSGKEGGMTEPSGRLKYFVIEAGQLFASSMSKARCILFVGGTLSPRRAITDQLLGDMGRGKVVEFECDHVVPSENVMTRICANGPSGLELEFTYRKRKSNPMIDELGRAIEQCVHKVIGGVVVFFSSYDLMGTVVQRWKQSGQFTKINSAKPIFMERRSEDNFQDYQRLVMTDKRKAAILFAVMGGKLSEGINFCDDLGRMVIVVGMPFGNALQLETAEVLKTFKDGAERNEYLENESITVVNQCIGRAVRHATDYATIVLLDRRFTRPRVMQKLPAFIRRQLACVQSFNVLQTHITQFFTHHNHNTDI